jgi:hypothetical protein
MKNRISHNDQVLEYLNNYGPISPLKAQSEFGCWRLASVINRLRNAGHNILTINRRTYSGKQFAEYVLIR